MKIFVNTLKGKMNFEIEVKPADTVSDVKKAIETVHGPLYPAAQQKLIYQGKVLKDETTLEENNVVENSCIVSKAKVSSSGASTASSPSVTQAQPAQTVATPAGADESEDSDGSEDVFYDAVEHQSVPPLPIHQYRHQYSQDGFQLHGLPDPVVGEVVAVVGEKRIGKTTALRVMAGKLQPNLCRPQNPPTWEETWEEIINRSTRPETRRYLERIRDEDLSVSMMEQEAGTDRELRDRTIRKVISSNNLGEPYRLWEILEKLDLDHSLLSYKPEHLTDGQFQRFSIAKTVLKHADSYVFDEPFSFLNLRQKAQAAKVIKSVLRRNPKSYVFLAENEPDLLAYMDAYACHITGIPQKRGEVVGRPEKITSEMEKTESVHT